MSQVHEITSNDEFNSLLSSANEKTLVAINFHTPWAEPCKQMNQAFATIAQQVPSSANTLFLSVDAEEHPDISESYDVSAVPFFVLVRNSTLLKSLSGADPATLKTAIESQSSSTFTLPPPQTITSPAVSTEPAPEAAAEEEDLNSRLQKLVSAAPVMLFMKGTPAAPQCGFSRQLVAMLREHGVRYGFFNILADDEVRQGLKTYSDWPTFPQLYKDGELIGGLDIVKEEFENDSGFLGGDGKEE